LRAPLQHSWRH